MVIARRKLAIVTGASTGIGFELARLAAANGYDLVVAANEPAIFTSARQIRRGGTMVASINADLSTEAGIDALLAATGGRPIDVLCANAGTALGHAFLEEPTAAWHNVVETNITGTLVLLHRVLPTMVARNAGKVLVTGSINGSIPGPYLAVYNATKAFLNSFTAALRDELRTSKGVTLTTLMPGPVETPIYDRAGMHDTGVGSVTKPNAAGVAYAGWEAMQRGDPQIVPGVINKIVEAVAHVVPAALTAAVHRIVAQPK